MRVSSPKAVGRHSLMNACCRSTFGREGIGGFGGYAIGLIVDRFFENHDRQPKLKDAELQLLRDFPKSVEIPFFAVQISLSTKKGEKSVPYPVG